MDADRDGGARRRRRSRTAPTSVRVRRRRGSRHPAGCLRSGGGVGQKRPLAEGRGAAAEPVTGDGSGDEPSGGDEDALRDDDDDAVPLSVAELYHEDDEDARPARESRDESVRQYEAASSNLDTSNAPPEAHPVCPVCALRLADVADTPLARVAHVNACLDGATYGHLSRRRRRARRGKKRRARGEWHDVAAWAHAVERAPPAFAEASCGAASPSRASRARRTPTCARWASPRSAPGSDSRDSPSPSARDAPRFPSLSRTTASRRRRLRAGSITERREHRTQNTERPYERSVGTRLAPDAHRVGGGARVLAAGSPRDRRRRARTSARKKKRSSTPRSLALPRRTRGDAAPRAGASRYVPAADAAPPPSSSLGSACPARGSSWTGSRATARATALVRELVPDALPRRPLQGPHQVDARSKTLRHLVLEADRRAVPREAGHSEGASAGRRRGEDVRGRGRLGALRGRQPLPGRGDDCFRRHSAEVACATTYHEVTPTALEEVLTALEEARTEEKKPKKPTPSWRRAISGSTRA